MRYRSPKLSLSYSILGTLKFSITPVLSLLSSKGQVLHLRQCFMSLTSHSPIEASLDRGQAFCKNSIRGGTIFYSWQRSVPSLFHCYWSCFKWRAQVRPNYQKNAFFFFLHGNCPRQLNGFCAWSRKVGFRLQHPSGWGRCKMLNMEQHCASLHFNFFSPVSWGSREKLKHNAKVFALIAGQLLLMACHFKSLWGRTIATIWKKM